jgi:ParB family chromosome partitioning protein
MDIDSLANSISKLGLLLPLSVLHEGDKYRVIDGNRRLEALKKIHKGNKDVEIPVLVQDADTATAKAMSLAANIERLPLHPVDQYEAFASIAKEGKSLAEIGETFGVSERAVQQRMALGALAPMIRDLVRQDKIELRHAKVLTRIPVDQQEKWLLSGEPMWKVVQAIQKDFDTNALSPTSSLAQFVEREVYVEAGGEFVSDLFSEEGKELWADPVLANELARMKVRALEQNVLADGWAFFREIQDWVANEFIVHDPALTTEQTQQMELLDAQLKELSEKLEATEDEAEGEQLLEQHNEISKQLEAIEGVWTDEQKSRLGVAIDARYDVIYGCEPRPKKENASTSGDAAKEDDGKKLSSALTMELDAWLTRAVHGALADNPAIAVRLLALAFLSDYFLFEKVGPAYSGVGVRADFGGKVLPAYDYGFGSVEQIVKECGFLKAKNFEARMKALDKVSDNDINVILAYVIGRSMMTRHRGTDLVLYLDKLKQLQIRKHFTPDMENFFGRLTKDQLKMVATDARIIAPKDFEAMKKKEAAEYVSKMVPADWVPEAMRPTPQKKG